MGPREASPPVPPTVSSLLGGSALAWKAARPSGPVSCGDGESGGAAGPRLGIAFGARGGRGDLRGWASGSHGANYSAVGKNPGSCRQCDPQTYAGRWTTQEGT